MMDTIFLENIIKIIYGILVNYYTNIKCYINRFRQYNSNKETVTSVGIKNDNLKIFIYISLHFFRASSTLIL